MLVILTSYLGREQLLSNLEIRNHLYGKELVIEGYYKDVDDQPQPMALIQNYMTFVGNYSIDNGALDVIREVLNEAKEEASSKQEST
jgi:hypothetical protein